MTRHPLALRRRTLASEDIDFAEPAAPLPLPSPAATARAFLIGMREAYGLPALQSMRVIMVVPGQRTREPPAARERIALETVRTAPARHGLRPIAGDLLRDAQGRLYERRADNTLRALGAVFAGTHGELYERGGGSEAEVEDVPPRAAETQAQARAEAEPAAAPRAPRRLRATSARERSSPRAAPAATAAAARAATVRRLLPAPGKWVQIHAGEFAALLQGQLAQPGRIAADYEIGAWLQVFDADAELDPADAARQIFADERMAARLAPWTTALAQRLGVTLGAQNGEGTRVGAAPGRIAAGQRFFALTIASDPTASDEPAPPAETAAQITTHTAPRNTVPPALQAAVLPRLSRDQAVAQLQHARSPAWWQRWHRRVGAGARAAWQQQLAGRSLDEQLWAVPPPPHGLGDAHLREWVLRTLRLAGYNAARMADEWEIHWRCRGATD
jgi:hypothetical protein